MQAHLPFLVHHALHIMTAVFLMQSMFNGFVAILPCIRQKIEAFLLGNPVFALVPFAGK